MFLFLNDEYRVVQRAAWVVRYSAEAYPQLIQKHFKPLIENLSKPNLHDSVKRNTLKVLQEIDAPEELLGSLVDVCFGFLYSANEAIAVKAFSINVLVNTCKKFPELKEELIPLLNELLNHDAPAILACTKRGLKELREVK